MAQAHAYAAACRFSDNFRRTFQFRSDCHHPNMTTRRLPKTIESLQLRRQQIRCRMYALASVADERPFQVNAERAGATIVTPVALTAIFDPVCETLQRAQGR